MDVDILVPVWAALLVLHPHDVQSLVDDGVLGGAPQSQVDPVLPSPGPVVAQMCAAAMPLVVYSYPVLGARL